MNLVDVIERERSALVIASGGSNAHAVKFLPHVGAVATVQRALGMVDCLVDYALFIERNWAEQAREHFHRVSNFLVPDCGLMQGFDEVRPAADYLPAGRLIFFPAAQDIHAAAHQPDSSHLASAYRDFGKDGRIWLASPASALVHILARIGYRWLICCGFCEADGTVDRETFRQLGTAVEVCAEMVGLRYGCRVVFWHPGLEAESWRQSRRTGRLFT